MTRKLVSSGSYLEPEIGFSRAVRSGNFIAIAGTAPIGADGKTDGVGDVYRQTVRCLEIIRKAIEDAGGSMEDVVRTRIMLTDAKTWKEAARAHGEVFADIRPVTTVMEVSGFVDPDWLVELEVDAVCQSEG
ncbi:RidA family protein [Nisaea acidiphila]|uniref:RidA family protein n=1 Tax=Nisaea acidiphila TaxID=1862145 RepID=A0A9J7AR92_9PROT|nr:RidA family protein [Nisaea acidiphila]UUX50131.1 RidA family protein [Nisaea acidiphila]